MIQKCNWRPDWGGSQIGAEARLVQRPDWCRGQIGAEARLAAHLSTAVAQREKSPSILSLKNIFVWY